MVQFSGGFLGPTLTFIFLFDTNCSSDQQSETDRSGVSGRARASLSLVVQTDRSRCNWEEGEGNMSEPLTSGAD